MSEWKKVELPPDPTPDPIPEPIPVTEAPPFDPEAELPPMIDTSLPPVADTPAPAAEPQPAEPSVRRRRRQTASAPRRHSRAAAPIGFLVLILALIGGIAVLVSGFRLIQKATDDTPLKEELAEFLEPVMLQNPTAFDGEEAAQNLSCIKAALWKVTETERIRMRQEKDACRFPTDDSDRLIIAEGEINTAFASLFGEEVAPQHALFAEQGDGFAIWYDTAARQYHLPAFSASLYQPVIDTVESEDGIYQVRVGYVAAEDIKVNDQGEDIPPTPADATVFQYFRVEETKEGYRLRGIVDAVAAQ